MIGKILCAVGFHKYDKQPKTAFIRNEKNRSFWQIEKTCQRCGKAVRHYFWMPKM